MLFKHYRGGECDSESIRAPKGFRRLGQGCYRTAILEKSTNIVYKVGNSYSNVHEATNYRKVKRKKTDNLGFSLVIPYTRTVRIPLVKEYVPMDDHHQRQYVAVQEFTGKAIETECPADNEWIDEADRICNCSRLSPICFATVLDRIRDYTGLLDIHSSNVLMDMSRNFWLIDMGE